MIFNTGSVVCCLGSSTTQHGYWVHDVQAYFAEIRHADKVTFYNCGVGGDTAYLARYRLEEDVYCYHPTHIFIMFGMNDIKRELYDPKTRKTPALLEKRENAITVYEESLKCLADMIQKRNIKVLFGIPAPYDTVQPSECENFHECADAIAKCADIVRKVTKECQCECIDIGGELASLKKEWDKNGEWLYAPDRVHPTRVGYGLIARIFLKNVVSEEIDIPMCLDDWNKNEPKLNERIFAMEEILRDIAYIDWGRFHPIHGECMGKEYKIHKMLEIYAASNCPKWLKRSVENYFKYSDKKDLLRQNIMIAKNHM